MANVQTENGFARIANELLDELSKRKLNGTQTSILFAVVRFTYGFNRKSHELSLTFIERYTGIKKKRLSPELKYLIDNKVLNVFSESSYDHKSREIGFNKNHDEWTLEFWDSSLKEEQSLKKGTVPEKEDRAVPKKGNRSVPKNGNQERNNKEIIKESVYTVFEHWKSKGVIAHKSLNSKMESHIKARLADYSMEDLLKAIDNYREVLTNDLYYWSHRWTLQDLMKPNNFVRFLDESKPFETFLASENKKQHKKDIDWEAFNLE